MSFHRAKRVARSVQTLFPFAQEWRTSVERHVRRALGSVHNPNFLGLKNLKIGPGQIVDVGANRGQSIESFRILFPGWPIISFEPNGERAHDLKWVYRSEPHIAIRHAGLSDTNSTLTLYMPRYRGWTFDGLASLDRREAMEWLCPGRFAWFDPAHLSCVETQATVILLDEARLKPCILKIDTQGHEMRVLKGGLETIREHRPVILLEDATYAIADLLRPFGYQPFIFNGRDFKPGIAVQNDTFFLP